MTTQRILLINEDGTAEVGGVECVLVPREPVAWIQRHAGYADRLFFASQIDHPRKYQWNSEVTWEPLLSAAAIDLSGLPVVPRRKQLGDEAVHGDRYRRALGWNQALDAMGVKAK